MEDGAPEKSLSHMQFSLSKTKVFGLITLLLILFSLPLIVLAAQTVQTIQQHASGKETVTLPNGSKLLFRVQVNGVVAGAPAVFYIVTKDANNKQHENPNNNIYTTNKDGTILLQVNPSDRLVIKPLTSRGYTHIVPETMEVNVLDGKCGVNTPCTFTAFPDGTVPSGSPTPTVACLPRPGCLDTIPQCLLPDPREGWCPSGTPTPSTTVTASCSFSPSALPLPIGAQGKATILYSTRNVAANMKDVTLCLTVDKANPTYVSNTEIDYGNYPVSLTVVGQHLYTGLLYLKDKGVSEQTCTGQVLATCSLSTGALATPTPAVTAIPTPTVALKKCPLLPSVCTYSGSGYCQISGTNQTSCTCGEIVCNFPY